MTRSADLELAWELADLADAITTHRFRARDLRISSKPDRTPVTDADLAVEDALRELLAEHRPEDAVAGEEGGGALDGAAGSHGLSTSEHDRTHPSRAESDDRTWVLDPIDGTKNFLRGLPVWASLIALVESGQPVVGVISAPALGRRWWAATGAGAWRGSDNGDPTRISVSKVGHLDDAYLSTTHLGSWLEHHSRDAYLRLVDACWENRAFGDFWQHCLVAEGAIDLAAEPIVNPWDVAAVQVLVEEAGGTVTDLSGNARYDGGTALSSNGALHPAALALLAREK